MPKDWPVVIGNSCWLWWSLGFMFAKLIGTFFLLLKLCLSLIDRENGGYCKLRESRGISE